MIHSRHDGYNGPASRRSRHAESDADRGARAARLEQIIKELQRHRFGRRAEKLPEDQLLLGLEEIEQTAASGEEDADEDDPTARKQRAAKRRLNRGTLPAHLPRVEITVDIYLQPCPCCQGALHRWPAPIGWSGLSLSA